MRVYIKEQLEIYRNIFPSVFERHDLLVQKGYKLTDIIFEAKFKTGFKLKIELSDPVSVIHLSQYIYGNKIELMQEYAKLKQKKPKTHCLAAAN